MKSLLILSGKGGTGKTSLAGAFAVLAADKILADCDVDAANLHLLLDPHVVEEGTYQGAKLAVRDATACVACGRCHEVCRFHAVSSGFDIDPFLCEGCGACVTACPADAIELETPFLAENDVRVSQVHMTGRGEDGIAAAPQSGRLRIGPGDLVPGRSRVQAMALASELVPGGNR